MTALSLGLLLLLGAALCYVIAILLAYFKGKSIKSISLFELKGKNFAFLIPFAILWLAGGLMGGIGAISLIIALLQYLGVL